MQGLVLPGVSRDTINSRLRYWAGWHVTCDNPQKRSDPQFNTEVGSLPLVALSLFSEMSQTEDRRAPGGVSLEGPRLIQAYTATSGTPRPSDLDEIWRAVARTSDPRAASRLLVDHLSRLLSIPVAVLRKAEDAWTIEGHAPSDAIAIARALEAVFDLSQGQPLAFGVPAGDRPPWTGIPLGPTGDVRWILMLAGPWFLWRATEWVESFSRHLSLALQISALNGALAPRHRLVLTLHTFTRRLAHLGPNARVHQFIIETLASAVSADIGALARYVPEEGSLRITATHGYPPGLVGSVRIPVGAGIIGGVFASRKPMLVRQVEQLPGSRLSRPRYRTPSFLAVPVLARGAGIGVVTLADRRDDQPFDRDDLTVIRALAAPAALALAHERLISHARELARAAIFDPLTGLDNRRYLETRLRTEVGRARRQADDLAVLMVDVDDFKAVNDSLGHHHGDDVLRRVATALRRSVRDFDVCARYGGDEFVILMPGADTASAFQAAERIREAVGHLLRHSGPQRRGLGVTVSIGIAALKGAEIEAATLITEADRALYLAKNAGKNCVRLASG